MPADPNDLTDDPNFISRMWGGHAVHGASPHGAHHTHAVSVRKFHCTYCSTLCFGRGTTWRVTVWLLEEGVVAMAGPHPDPVGRALLMAVCMPHDRGVTPDVILRVGEPPSRLGGALEMGLVLGTTERTFTRGPHPPTLG